MTFYEQELRKLFADGTVIGSPTFAGRACLGTLGKDLRVRVQFVTSGHADHYDAISITVLNRTDGVVDKLRLRLKDVLGVKQVPGNPNFRSGVLPYIWDDYGKVEWYAFRPSAADYTAMRGAVSEYLDVFRDRTIEQNRNRPKLIYICAPLRGEVEKNIAFAQDQAAREMGLRLVESCQQVNVYGPTWTDGMRAEIRHAERMGIPIMTDQKELGRPPQKNSQKKEKPAYER